MSSNLKYLFLTEFEKQKKLILSTKQLYVVFREIYGNSQSAFYGTLFELTAIGALEKDAKANYSFKKEKFKKLFLDLDFNNFKNTFPERVKLWQILKKEQ